MRRRGAVVAAAVLLVAAACSGDGDTAEDSARDAGAQVAADLALPEAVADPTLVDVRTAPVLRSHVDARRSVVVVVLVAGDGDCDQFARAEHRRKGDELHVRVFLGDRPGADCSLVHGIGRPRRFTIPVEGDLPARVVDDAPA